MPFKIFKSKPAVSTRSSPGRGKRNPTSPRVAPPKLDKSGRPPGATPIVKP